MPLSREDIDIAMRGELENIMVLDGLPYSSLTCVIGYNEEYSYILKLLLRTLNCLKLVASKKNIKLDIRAFIEMPANYHHTNLYKRWSRYKRNNIGYTVDFRVEELRDFYNSMEECKNFYIENVINRGESRDFVKEWKGIIAKCAAQHPGSKNPFRLTEVKDPMGVAVKPFQILRDAKLMRVEELSAFKDVEVNGRLEMSTYMYISNMKNLMEFLEGSFK